MEMEIHLTDSNDYSTDIAKLRQDIITNGTQPNTIDIKIAVPNIPDAYISMKMNIAYEENLLKEAPASSLYILSFTGIGGFTFTFGQDNNPSGSYKSLGYDVSCKQTELPEITNKKLNNAITGIYHFNGKDRSSIGMYFSIIIVTISEALRFQSVEDGINRILGSNKESYQPRLRIVKDWGGHLLPKLD